MLRAGAGNGFDYYMVASNSEEYVCFAIEEKKTVTEIEAIASFATVQDMNLPS